MPVYVVNANGEIKTDEQVLLAAESITATEIANRTRKFFVPCGTGADTTTPADLPSNNDYGVRTPDAKASLARGFFIVPSNFVSGMTVTLVAVPQNTGDVYVRSIVTYGACGESVTANSDQEAFAAIAISAGLPLPWNCIQENAMSTAAVGDLVKIQFDRAAADVLDTIGGYVDFPGWIVEYIADS